MKNLMLMEKSISYKKDLETYGVGKIPVANKVSVLSAEDLQKDILEELAKECHEEWKRGRIEQGWAYGSVQDDANKISCNLVSWEELDEISRESSYLTARETLNQMKLAGFAPVNIEELIYKMAKAIHDNWALDLFNKGFVWGPERNKDQSKGILTHPDLLSFEDLLEYYPDDVKFDMDTARATVNKMIRMGYAFAAA